MYSRDYTIKVDFKVFPTQLPFDTNAVFVNGDIGCKMIVHLVSGGVPIDLTDSLITINIKESNDSVYTLPCEILDKLNGIVSINLPHSLNDDVGINIFEIAIRNSDDSMFVSPLLKYKVVRGIGAGDIPKEDPKLLILDTLISKVQDAINAIPPKEELIGEKGDKGDKGDAFTYDDFTPEQLEGLRGPQGLKGDTGAAGRDGEQGAQGERGLKGDKGDKGDKGERGLQGAQGERGLQGEKGDKGDKGDKGEQGLAGSSYNDTELRELISVLTKRIDELEKGNMPPIEDDEGIVIEGSYCGQMAFKPVDTITMEDLERLVNRVDVIRPQTIYAHSGDTAYNKTVICAIPKTQWNIKSVIDGAGVDITASYPITEKEINGTIYMISCNKVAQAYNKSTVVKFNIN